MYTEELKSIIESHRKWITGEGGVIADLSRANLFGADLCGANLPRANLSRADLSGANLSRANLFGADLSGANLPRANLSRADLSGANLSRADLSGADLSGANLFEADLSRAVWGDKCGCPMFIGPIGSRTDTLMIQLVDGQLVVKTGCFTGSVEKFKLAVSKSHSGSKFEKDYLSAIQFAEGILL